MEHLLREKRIYLHIKIILLFSTILFLFLVFLAFAYIILRAEIENEVRAELQDATANTLRLTQHAVDVSIRNYLRAIAEKNLEIVERFDRMIKSGDISEKQGMKELREVLLSQKIGDTGYIYVWDISNAPDSLPLVVHPLIEGQDLSPYAFARRAAEVKNGYIEYDWQNPIDKSPRSKAVYLSYYEPWHWLIAASSYRDEFHELINMDDIKSIILSQRFGKTGYSFIVDYNGNMVIHPEMSGNVRDTTDKRGFPLTRTFLDNRIGFVEYYWKNRGDPAPRKKYAYFHTYPELKWIIVSSGYQDEFYYPLRILSYVFLMSILGSLTIFTVFFIWSRSTIIKPIRELIAAFEQGSSGNLSVRIPVLSNNEIYLLGGYFNTFMNALQENHDEIEEDRQKLRIAEAQYRSASEYLDNIVNSLDSSLITVQANGEISQWNQAASLFTGILPEDAIGKNYLECLPFLNDYTDRYQHAFETNSHRKIVLKSFYRDKERYLQVNFNPLLFNGSRGVVLRIDDITEAQIKDQQLMQAQKMEVIGNLAGGLAHDFNNVLGGITGTISLIEFELAKDTISNDNLIRYASIISQSAYRAREVVEQLLTISQKREVDFTQIVLQDSIENVLQICRNTFDKSIEIETDLPEKKALCNAEASQIEQALLNLFINASHAMTIMRDPSEKHGGTLSIALTQVEADSLFTENHPEAQQIKYWCISISDSGVGMDSKTISKIFEPFFSLKKRIKGSGLGLSMVYNIIRQHGGFIDIYSEINIGTVFNIFLPVATTEHQEEPEKTRPSNALEKGSGTILVVDDNDIIRATARDILHALGYKVIIAEDGEIGVETYRQRQHEIDAVILDMVMPHKSGREAFKEIKVLNPDARIAIASGYRMDRRVQEVMDDGADLFIQKPYTLKEMSEAAHRLTSRSE